MKMNEELKYCLENLEMIGDSDCPSGLLPVQEISKNQNLPPEEIIALENASKYGAQYVYFRQFENRPSVPQVYLYDYTDRLGVEEDELTNLHKQLYSSGQVPMFFVFTKKDVRIFNCFESPSEGKNLKYTPLTTIKIAADLSKAIDSNKKEEFKAFSGRSIDNGTFWENSKYSSHFKFSNSAYEKLLTELKQALKDIISQDILPANFARKIMVISILIKYLEEREDDKGNRVFPDGFFSQFANGALKFTDVLNTKGAYLTLLDYLAKHFNGGIFQLESDEREFIEEKDLTRFGQFLDGDVDGIQFVFWRLYSFNDLPVELISNIYEEFLGKQPGVVYTPPYLVNFLLDEAMPLSSEQTDFKVLDPACGSGVFLVGAYRRLIYRWRKKNNWNYPDLVTLKKLLRENIFGIELNKDAANLTIFSLSLALCDELTPLEIWKDLKFDSLHEENILHDDFFNQVSKSEMIGKFDLIIGNPPFEAKLTEAAKNIETVKHRDRIISTLLGNGKQKDLTIKLPDNQVSLLFLEQSVELCKKGGLVCLIQPSGPLLYNSSSFQFRQVLLNKYHVPQIIDFTHISRILFGKNGDVATAAIFIKNEKSTKNGLLHITVRRTKTHKEKLYFELDTYDFHHVPLSLALNDYFIWKSNFIGGHRYHQLLTRLRSFPTVGEFLSEKVNQYNWDVGEGYIIGNRNEIEEIKSLKNEPNKSESQYKKLDRLSKKYKLASFITNENTFDPKDFTVQGLSKDSIYRQQEEFFVAPRRRKIYEPPHILVKELVEGMDIPVLYTEEYLTFKHRVIGIHSPKNDDADLKHLYQTITNKTNLLVLALTSAEFMVNRSSSFLRKDLNSFLLPEKGDDFKLTNNENIIFQDFLDYLIEFRRTGEKSKIAVQNASHQELSEFGEVYCQILQSVFKTIKPSHHFETDSYICYPFYFGEEPTIDFSNSELAEKHIEQLVYKNSGVSLRLTRIVRLYEGNVIYLIKPKKLRYWLKSIALRDADETFSDLRKQGF